MSNQVSLSFNEILRIQDLGFHTIKNLYTHPNRILNWNVFIYVSNGEMQVSEEGNEYVVQKGQFLFLKSGLHHWGVPKTPAGTSWYWIHFFSNPSNETQEELNMFLNPYSSLSLSQEYRKFVMLPKQGSIPHPKKLEIKLDSILRLYQSTDPFRAIDLSMQTMDLLLNIFKDSNPRLPLTKSDLTVQRIIEYLEHKDGFSLDSRKLSAHLNMNYSYLSEVFKTKTGSTIQTYNAQIFLDKAVSMMRNSSRNISEISETLGFNNPYYFSRVFRKIIGCSPSEYMNRIYRD